jgi:hypothetical protein
LADIFHEVDEEVRRERLQKLWDRYSVYVIGLAVLIVVGVSAWRGYTWWQDKKAAAAGAQFEAALSLSDEGKHADADAAFAKIAAEAPAGYRALARFRAAAALAQIKPADAVKAYDDLAADASLGPTLQDLAAVRAGMLVVDTASLADMKRRLDPVAEPRRAFRHNHDFTAARHYIDMIAGDGETPTGIRTRADILAALIAADGSKS